MKTLITPSQAVALAFTDARLVRRPDYDFAGLENFLDLADNPPRSASPTSPPQCTATSNQS